MDLTLGVGRERSTRYACIDDIPKSVGGGCSGTGFIFESGMSKQNPV